MGFFSSLFSSKIKSKNLSVDINDNGIYINDTLLSLPCHAADFTKVLKKPTDIFNFSDGSAHYVWKNLGVICYTHDGKTVHTAAFMVNPSQLAEVPDGMNYFKGNLTVDGMQWESVMKSAGKSEFFSCRMVGKRSVVSEFYDFMDDSSLAGVEVSSSPSIIQNYNAMVEEYLYENNGN